ncbi:MAG: hypothetical protein NVSMB6_18030 [Burkholderiaceae bacterium]
MPAFAPYLNEEDSLSLGQLTLENRLDRVTLYGTLDLTRDRAGLEKARVLRDLLQAVVTSLEGGGPLPAHVAVKPAEKVRNPFA